MVFSAIKFVAEAHEGHYRKGTKVPYIYHLVNVMKILCDHDCDDEVVAAGILHDVVEDTPVTLAVVEEKFGKRIANIVAGASEAAKIYNDATLDTNWKSRKQHTISYIANEADIDSLLVSCADKLDNARSILEDHNAMGDALWGRFNAGKEEQEWYFSELSKAFEKRAESCGQPLKSISDHFAKTVRDIFSA